METMTGFIAGYLVGASDAAVTVAAGWAGWASLTALPSWRRGRWHVGPGRSLI